MSPSNYMHSGPHFKGLPYLDSNQGKSVQINDQASNDVWCGSLDTDEKRGRTIGKGRDENATMDTRSIIAG